MVKLKINKNIMNLLMPSSILYGTLNTWCYDNNYRYGKDYIYNYSGDISCRVSILDHIRSVWEYDNNLYVLSPKFEHTAEILDSYNEMSDIIEWVDNNATVEYNIYYKYNIERYSCKRFISSKSVEDIVLFKMRFG